MSTLYSIGAMNQLGDALEKAGFSPDDVTKLKQYSKLEKVLDLLHGRAEIAPVAQKILSDASSTTFTAPAGKFVVRDHFTVDTGEKAKVKISYLGDNFQDWFLGKIEEHAGGEITLRGRNLNRSSVDGPIIAELGSEAKAETTLAEVFALMEKQGNREEGALFTNGYANIFYVRDANGVLRAVSLIWLDGGWRVSALSVASPRGWRAGLRVFSS